MHLMEKRTSEREVVAEIHDAVVGLKLKSMKVKGTKEVKKVTRREVKVIFMDKGSANDFLNGTFAHKLSVEAFIPKYNVRKTGIVFDIPATYTEEYLRQNFTSEVPIVDVYRCKKRKWTGGNSTGEWIAANTVKVTLGSQYVPDEICFGYSKRKVKPDVPKPTQCHKCLRFGHIQKFCKQERATCYGCGTQHEWTPEEPCKNGTKCFHCHSDKHGATSTECPEYMRNALIKETMFYNNVTFQEANESFPKTQSQFRLTEKRREFPTIGRGDRTIRGERVEKSFPRKTNQELQGQYERYVALNRGEKVTQSASGTGTKLYSEMTKEKTQDDTTEVKGMNETKARDLIRELGWKLGVMRKADQRATTSLDNDVMLIDIARMVMEFLLTENRNVVSYSDHEEGDTELKWRTKRKG